MLELTVNRERCIALANMLTLAPQRHNQRYYLEEKPQNECGTVGCAAGWATLASAGIVTIAPDGTMTWSESSLKIKEVWRKGRAITVRTLKPSFFGGYMTVGAEWLGLDDDAAQALFIRTAGWYRAEELAIEILRRLGDDRLTNGMLTPRSVDNLARKLRHRPRPDLDQYAG